MNLKEALRKCDQGNHILIEILRSGAEDDCDHVARWCKVCGSVVVDLECDNRLTGPGRILKMKGPLTANGTRAHFYTCREFQAIKEEE